MKKYIVFIVVAGVVIWAGFSYFDKERVLVIPELLPGEVFLGQNIKYNQFFVVTVEEEGMKSILGNINMIENGKRVVITRFNGSLEKLKETFTVDNDGFSYTEFQSFGSGEYNFENYKWKYDVQTKEYKSSE
ncbi:MAG TPA: hypothetical protein VJI73_02610 [Candidatus Paceibacterota bacterium]